jgi:hypothetical protein
LKLGDFGFARAFCDDHASLKKMQTQCGTYDRCCNHSTHTLDAHTQTRTLYRYPGIHSA